MYTYKFTQYICISQKHDTYISIVSCNASYYAAADVSLLEMNFITQSILCTAMKLQMNVRIII